MNNYLLGRVKLVKDLIDGPIECHYNDLVLILTAVMSACAAIRWPNQGFDKKRFVELLINHSNPDFHCDYVCLAGLLTSGIITEGDSPWGKPGQGAAIFTDADIDLSLMDAQKRYPNLSLSRLLKNHVLRPAHLPGRAEFYFCVFRRPLRVAQTSHLLY